MTFSNLFCRSFLFSNVEEVDGLVASHLFLPTGLLAENSVHQQHFLNIVHDRQGPAFAFLDGFDREVLGVQVFQHVLINDALQMGFYVLAVNGKGSIVSEQQLSVAQPAVTLLFLTFLVLFLQEVQCSLNGGFR